MSGIKVHRQNFAVVRTYNVEGLNNTLKEFGRIVCYDAKLDRPIEIRFIPDGEHAQTDVTSDQKIKMIEAILKIDK